MYNRKPLFTPLLLLALALCACKKENIEPSSGGSGPAKPPVVNAPPNVNIACSAATQCANGQANQKRAYAYWYRSACSEIWQSHWADYYKYGSANVSCSGGACTGIVSAWTDNAVTGPMREGDYALYLYIDTTNDSVPTPGEPTACIQTVTVTNSSPSATVSSWFDYSR